MKAEREITRSRTLIFRLKTNSWLKCKKVSVTVLDPMNNTPIRNVFRR
jgi:hypothetical protein